MPESESRLTLDRRSLFERVWSSPMRTVAAELGLSDVGLAKACRRMQIPVPGRGYWAKAAAGRKGKRPSLKPLLTTDNKTQRELVVDLRERDRAAAKLAGPIGKQAVFEADPRNRIVVKANLRGAHPLVTAFSKAVAEAGAKSGEYVSTGRADTLDVHVTKELLPRALRVMDALLRAFETRGWPVRIARAEQRHWVVRVADRDVPFGIREPWKKIRNEPAIPRRIGRGEMYTPYQPVFRDEPAGRLSLVIRNGWGSGVHRSIDERAGPPVEERLNAFVLLIATEGYRQAEAARLREERELERIEAAERYHAEERRKAAAKAKVNELVEDATSWRLAMDLRAYQAAVAARADEVLPLGSADPDVVAWLKWVSEVVEARDPLCRELPVWRARSDSV